MKINNLSFVKLVLLSAFLFLIIILLVEFLFSLNSNESVSQILSQMTNTDYIIKKGVGSLLYGIIMALIMKKKFKIQNK